MEVYRQRVFKYTRKKLSFESDSLNAFAGIIRQSREAETPVYQFWGIPFLGPTMAVSADEILESFVSSLASSHWSKPAMPHRRAQFPSWSWAGWAGEVTYSAALRDNFESLVETIDLESASGHVRSFFVMCMFFSSAIPQDKFTYPRILHFPSCRVISLSHVQFQEPKTRGYYTSFTIDGFKANTFGRRGESKKFETGLGSVQVKWRYRSSLN